MTDQCMLTARLATARALHPSVPSARSHGACMTVLPQELLGSILMRAAEDDSCKGDSNDSLAWHSSCVDRGLGRAEALAQWAPSSHDAQAQPQRGQPHTSPACKQPRGSSSLGGGTARDKTDMEQSLAGVSMPTLAALRSVCRAWRLTLDKELQHLLLRSWPPPASLCLPTIFPRLRTVRICFQRSTRTQPPNASSCMVDGAQPAVPGMEAGPADATCSTHSTCGTRCLPSHLAQGGTSAESVFLRAAPAECRDCPDASAPAALAGGSSSTALLCALARLPALRDLQVQLHRQEASVRTGGRRDAAHRGFTATLLRGLHVLPGLQRLSLHGPGIQHLPAAVLLSLSQLQVLSITNTNLRSLPPTLGRLAHLEHLSVTHNRGVTSLPEASLRNLSSLKTCNLQQCRLQRLPAHALATLTQLTALDVSGNRLAALPSSFGHALHRLRALDLSHNQLATLPPSASALSCLTSLRLAGNWKLGVGSIGGQAQCDPITACLPRCLPWLEVLDLSGMGLKGLGLMPLPPQQGSSSNGDVNHGRVSVGEVLLTSSSSNSPSLAGARGWTGPGRAELGATGCVTPPCSRVPVLRELQLASNELAEVPSCLMHMPLLSTLGLDYNNLTALPDWLPLACSRLAHLNVSGNRLAALPSSLSRLGQSLVSLTLSSNRLASLAPSLSALSRLTDLDLSDNSLGAAPPLVLWQMTALESLSLASNRLRCLPTACGALAALKWLDLCDNRLHSLPLAALTALRQLQVIKASGNPLARPSPHSRPAGAGGCSSQPGAQGGPGEATAALLPAAAASACAPASSGSSPAAECGSCSWVGSCSQLAGCVYGRQAGAVKKAALPQQSAAGVAGGQYSYGRDCKQTMTLNWQLGPCKQQGCRVAACDGCGVVGCGGAGTCAGLCVAECGCQGSSEQQVLDAMAQQLLLALPGLQCCELGQAHEGDS
ncbi:hypothetical protein V8C86DRAFT_536997 [Haematococcus lacustris]